MTIHNTLVQKSFRIFIIACLIPLLSAGLQAQTPTAKDSTEARNAYFDTKKGFDAYEKAHGHYIQTPNARMHYLSWGDQGSIPLVWVHGTYSNGYELLEIADSLVKMGFYVLAIDYYGHGYTPIPKKEVSLYHVADDIKFLMDDLKIRKAVIGGWSRGGSVATAFYDAYPSMVLGLVLEDGGSVAWDFQGHKKPVDTLEAEIRKTYRYGPREFSVNSEFDAYYWLYRYFGIKGKQGLKLKKEIYTSIPRIKQDSLGKWQVCPGVFNMVCENTAEQLLSAIHRPYAANHLFGASTHLLYPKLIYRNLDVPMIIFDPVSKNDWFDFESENSALREQHPNLVMHMVYRDTWHGVKDQNPERFLNDLRVFLDRVKKHHGL